MMMFDSNALMWVSDTYEPSSCHARISNPLRVFVAAVGSLAALNLYRHPNHIWFVCYYWCPLSLVGWGLALAAHAYAVFYSARGRARSAARAGVKT